MSNQRTLRIGTRASQLARWQSDWTAEQLTQQGRAVEIVEIATGGDVQQSGPIAGLNQTGVFTKEIQTALLNEQIDIAVHSLKDLPTEQVAGLALAATPCRAETADALVARGGHSLDSLPQGAVVGTGSLRRRAQLMALRPDLVVRGIRGNVDTRLAKLDDGQYDAICLAAAGLNRLGLGGRIDDVLAPPRMLPAPGQGALGIECRATDHATISLLNELNDAPTRQAVEAERGMLAALHGGCSAPIAAWGRIEHGRLLLDGLVADLDGLKVLRASASGPIDAASEIASRAAEDLLKQGARQIIQAARDAT